jgi:hypothetical protein
MKIVKIAMIAIMKMDGNILTIDFHHYTPLKN